MNSPLFSLRRWQKIVRGGVNPAAFQISLRSALKEKDGLLLLVLLYYKRVLLIIWIVAVIFWFVSEVLLVDPEVIPWDAKESR